jgi:signal transduction histidine kinase
VRAVESKDQDMLNRLTAIQAAAEILDDHEDLSANDRRLFLFVIRSETKRLHRMIEEASA